MFKSKILVFHLFLNFEIKLNVFKFKKQIFKMFKSKILFFHLFLNFEIKLNVFKF